MTIENGFTCETVKKQVAPFVTQHGLNLDTVYIGRCCFYENGKRLWCQSSGIQRISKGDAIKDAQRDAKDLAITRAFNEAGVK